MAVVDRIRELVAPVVADAGADLYDIEFSGGILRILVDAEGGIDIDVIKTISRSSSRILDDADPIPGRYTLEVSSPGLERKLRTLEHFQGAVDEDVNVKLAPHVDGDRRVRGVLTRVDDESIVLDVDGDERIIEIADITKAVTVFEWGPAPKPGEAGSAKSKNPDAEGDSGTERRAAAR